MQYFLQETKKWKGVYEITYSRIAREEPEFCRKNKLWRAAVFVRYDKIDVSTSFETKETQSGYSFTAFGDECPTKKEARRSAIEKYLGMRPL